MKVLILAAGYATRLYPLTENKPKCLLMVGGRTILDALIEKINAVRGVDEILIVTNNKFDAQLAQFGAGEAAPRPYDTRIPIRVINDGTTSNDNRLGAIGDLDFVIHQCNINDDILMLASDNLFDGSLEEFAAFAAKQGGVSTGLHDIGDPMLAAGKYGVFEMGGGQEIGRIEEKPAKPRSSLIGMGIYYFPKTTLGKIRDYLKSPDAKDAPGHYLQWLVGKLKIFGFIFLGMWYDIGDLNALKEADRILSDKKGK